MKKSLWDRFTGSRGAWLLFAAVLAVQLVCLFWMSAQKQEFHIDEIYSYILSNGYEYDRVSNREEVWNTWIRGSDLESFVTVDRGEQFAYGRVYRNNALDAHPPLYYFLFHTLCSFFPGVFSKWFGLGLNIFLFALSQTALFVLSKRILGDNPWAVVPAAILGGTRLGLDGVLFMRMYALLTLLTVLLLLLHHRMLSREKPWDPAACFALTFLGVFTHYYFAIPAFFLAAFFCLRYWMKHQWKRLALYAAAMLAGVVCVFLVYPAALLQITGSPTNNVGNSVFGDLLKLDNTLTSIEYIGWFVLVGIFGSLGYSLPLTGPAALLTCLLAVKKPRQKDGAWKPDPRLFLMGLGLLLLSFLVICHISNYFTFVRYVYHLVPLLALVSGYGLRWLAARLKCNGRGLCLGFLCLCLVTCVAMAARGDSEYMLEEYAPTNARVQALSQDRPLLLVGRRRETFFPTTNFQVLCGSSRLFMNDTADPADIAAALEDVDTEEGVVFLLLTDKVWTDGLDGPQAMAAIVAACPQLSSFQKLGDCVYGMYYLAQ
ncbi:MAG: glycosyltransferase family 39 protein [Oscillospiraceae bacterium]|nr:glycosyltransferase family 39 protein [Oscillospiraceae bacterium]